MEAEDSNSNSKFHRYKDLFEHVSNAIGICKSEGSYVEINAGFCKLTGYSHDDLLNISFQKLSHPDDFNQEARQFNLLIDGKINHYSYEKRYIHKDGSFVWVKQNVSTLPKEKNQPMHLIVSVEEITDRKHDAELLKKLSTAIDSSQVSIIITNKDGSIEFANPYFTNITGYSKEEYSGRNPRILKTDYHDNAYYKLLWDTITSGKTWQGEFYNLKKNGEYYWEKAIISPIINNEGIITHFVAIKSDITEQKKAEQGLQENEAKLRAIFECSRDAIGVSKAGLHIIANPSYLKLFGFENNEQIAGVSILNSIAPDSRTKMQDNIKRRSHKEPLPNFYESRGMKADGTEFDAEFKISTYELQGEVYSVVTIRDITERKQAEEELRNSREKFLKIFERAPTFISISEINTGLFIDINDFALKYLGFSRSEVVGHTSIEIGSISIETRNVLVSYLQRYGRIDSYEIQLKNKKGDLLYGLLNAEKIIINQIECLLLIITDITQRKDIEAALETNNIELKQAKDKAEESDRLKTAFIQNISHEIRTPMNAIMGFSELMVIYYSDKEKLERYSEIIRLRCNDLLEIISNILDIAKIESGQVPINPENCNLSNLFNELTGFFKDYQKRIGKEYIKFNIEINRIQSELSIIIDKSKLIQILNILVNNAFKFTETGSIKVGFKFIENNHILFFVSDTGIGISKEEHQRIFNRFYQINQGKNHQSEGSGLGLSVAKGLVERMSGQIWLTSDLGKGTTFFFSLPYETATINKIERKKAEYPKEYLFPDKIVLIVEDDLYNAEYLKILLSQTQMNILQTISGKEAVQIASVQPVDIVLMDIRLPDIDGYEAVRQIKQFKPQMKIIAQTAYASFDEKQKAMNAGCDDYINKPTKKDLLLSMIRNLLLGF